MHQKAIAFTPKDADLSGKKYIPFGTFFQVRCDSITHNLPYITKGTKKISMP